MNKQTYLFVSEAAKIVGCTAGNTEAMEKSLRNRGLEPFGYLKGTVGGALQLRPFYLESQAVEVSKRPKPPRNDKERIADLENKLSALMAKLGEKP